MSHLDRFQRRLALVPPFPKLRPVYELVEVKPGHYLFYSGLQSFEMHQPFPGQFLPAFVRRLDGQTAAMTLLETLTPFQAAFCLDVLETLQRAGLLINGQAEGAVPMPPRYEYYAQLFEHIASANLGGALPAGAPALDWPRRLRQARVGLIGLGRVGSQLARLLGVIGLGRLSGVDDGLVDEALLLTDAWYDRGEIAQPRPQALAHRLAALNPDLEFMPLPLALEGGEALPAELLDHDLVVVAADRPSPQLYETVNRHCLEAGIAWTSYRPAWDGLIVEVGPTVIPRQTACYACYQLRRRGNLPDVEEDRALEKALNQQALPLLAMQITPCVSLLAYEVLRLLSGAAAPLTCNAIMTFDVLKGELAHRPLLKNPRCPTCRRDVRAFAPGRFWAELQAEWAPLAEEVSPR